MKILIVEPMRHPRRADIPNTLRSLQNTVGGYIQAIYPYDDPIAVVCNEEGKLEGLELNRYIPEAMDIIAGTFFICGLGEEDFTDLPDDLADKYEKLFHSPQTFYVTSIGVIAIEENGREVMIRL